VSSESHIAANKRNAQKSRGPRTLAGKARVSRNALSHGLATRPFKDKNLSAEVEKLARALAQPHDHPALLAQGRIIAEAELDLQRIKVVKMSLLNAHIGLVGPSDSLPKEEITAACGDDDVPQGGPNADDIGAALINALPQLIRLDRYERRARSRQARAIQRLIAQRAITKI
jgi:hypothetical protein